MYAGERCVTTRNRRTDREAACATARVTHADARRVIREQVVSLR
jgi:hypothetical protein